MHPNCFGFIGMEKSRFMKTLFYTDNERENHKIKTKRNMIIVDIVVEKIQKSEFKVKYWKKEITELMSHDPFVAQDVVQNSKEFFIKNICSLSDTQ